MMPMQNLLQRFIREKRGNTLVEFALISILMAGILLGIFEFELFAFR